ncbi:unnamed protein product [Cuscuta campestris]|uniref:RRM domain-containing protein n=1 Tax=Cuscuta campestris TaxID=132261 RepID=A0A484LUP4_9ASTE|nr:unnamed protein product [Cuscuta campestris]
MSLHLGNIPPHIRRDELEHVFHRFGRCTVRLKDKYGFVVYDYPANAEKALNTLRGKTICGKPITLSWSNMQPKPKPFRRFSMSTRSFEPSRGKYFGRHDQVSRDFDYNSHRRHRRELRSATETGGGRTVHAEQVDDYASHQRYEEGHTLVDDFPDYSGGREATVLQNGEVKEQCLEPLYQNGLEDGPEFDRYVPSCTDEIDELHHLTCMEKSASPSRAEEETERERPNAGGYRVPSSLQVDVKEKENSRSRDRSRHRDSSRERTAHRRGRKDYRKDYGKNKRRKATIETPSFSKNDRAPVTNSTCSNRTASGSHSHSRSFKSLSQPSDLMPNSSPARRNSQHSSLRSGSTSHSRSASPISHSLSGSLDRSLSSNKMHTVKKDFVSELKDNELKGQPPEKSDASSDNSFEVKDSHASESYTGDHMVRSVFSHTLVGTGELQNSNDSTEQHEKALEVIPDVQISERSHVSTLMKLSSDEVDMVLKHYRLEGPEEMQKNLPVEDCFGCARLWPWEIVYYRRYKKGHISTENYTRRLAQNKEFGIVDKFVRSSSGWGEV